MEKVSNQYAAMPSLHCGWAMWVTASTFGLVRTRVMKVAVVLLPVVTIFVVVVTANHYLLDAVGGAAHHDRSATGVTLFVTRAGYVPLRGYRMKGAGPSRAGLATARRPGGPRPSRPTSSAAWP